MKFIDGVNVSFLDGDYTKRCLFVGAFLFGISLPLSTALVSLGLLLMCVGAILNYRELRFHHVIKEPLVYIPLFLFAVLGASMLWTQAGDSADYLSKYRKLLFVLPFTLIFVFSRVVVKFILFGFLLANGIALFFSFYCWVSQDALGYGFPHDPSVFKKHITHNFFMALAVVAWIELAFLNKVILKRCVFFTLAFLGMINVWFMVDGRTGQVALLFGLSVWLFIRFYHFRLTILFWVLFCLPLLIIAMLIFYLDVFDIYTKGIKEILICQNILQKDGMLSGECNTSMGARYSFIVTALNIVNQFPLGIGVGGFPEPVLNHYHNPHNDYLLYLMQLGWAGLILYFVWVGRLIIKSCSQEQAALCAFAVAYAIGNIFNSFSLDFNEGYLYMLLTAYVASNSINGHCLRSFTKG